MRHRFLYRTLSVLILGLTLAGCGRGEEPPPDTSPGAPQAPTAPGAELRPVALPAMEGFEEAIRLQFQEQYARVQALAERPTPDTTALGAAYGLLGQLLLAYDADAFAEPALHNAALLQPDDVRWPYYLGYLYQQMARPVEAASWLTHALVLEPRDVPARVHLARVYRDLGRDADAEELLREAVALDPACAAAYFMLGQLADDPAQAIVHYKKVLALQPAAAGVHDVLGLAYRRQGNQERSRYHLARRGDTPARLQDPRLMALERLKEGASARISQAQRLMGERRFREATLLLEAVVAEEPDHAGAYLIMGAAYGQLGDRDKSQKALEQALRIDPTESKAYYNLGLLYGMKGALNEALEQFDAAVEIDPAFTEAHLAAAEILWRRGQCREALPHFEAFVGIASENIKARIDQTICHVAVEEFAEARALLEAGYEAFPQHLGLQDALVRVLAASADATVRDGPRALTLAEALVATLPRAETLESLAMAYAEVGRFAEAIQTQQAALQAARQQGLTHWLPHLDATLQRYTRQQPCRTPWDDVVFMK